MKIECKFDEYTEASGNKLYQCSISSVEIEDSSELRFIGLHKDGKTIDDVTFVTFYHCTIAKIPQELTRSFPNLKILCINSSKLKEISKDGLGEYINLERFIFDQNELEFLPGDLFDGFASLKRISFADNKLEMIEPNILDDLNQLEHVDFRNNPCFDKCYSIHQEWKPNATLEEVKTQLAEKFFSTNLENVKRLIDRYEQPVEEVKKYVKNQSTEKRLELLELKTEIFGEISNRKNEEFKNSEEQLTQQIQQLKDDLEIKQQKIDDLSSQLTNGIFGDLKRFIQNDRIKDFVIIIDSQEFPVHKFLLAARSPTLAETLSLNPDAENMNITDVSVEVLEQILRYLYTDEFPCEDETDFLEIFAAAGRLKIEGLKKYAGEKILNQINPKNALEIFNLANKYKHDELKCKAFEEVKKKFPKIELKDEWVMDSENVAKVIEVLMKKEEAMKRLEEEFEGLIMESKKINV